MVHHPPPPPSISPQQMTLLRVVSAMAWSDGNLSQEEADLMVDQFSRLFAQTPQQQRTLQQELQDYLVQNIPLEELVPRLSSQEERELVLRLGYAVISSSARTPEEALINQEEEAAYQRLVGLLDLPEDVVERVEGEAKADVGQSKGLVEHLTEHLQQFLDS
ncbi:hypothetical protein XM38_030380 [Halomicronema hongdechloris C2206]|uniref:Co-chaperone DjlA N-terminal domain-containing protein n=1 Tax=Halomicronema hongdechloris C2206 TaxID=1641165 RepID=A0A1Z3HP39_9CYAN|nr:TerB family tellurite resistance protein [Halomicronema hongdechloris]ASC72084.1 hypothetical protein XM38_030380 [Halomicronema hongdechloris C2206]